MGGCISLAGCEESREEGAEFLLADAISRVGLSLTGGEAAGGVGTDAVGGGEAPPPAAARGVIWGGARGGDCPPQASICPPPPSLNLPPTSPKSQEVTTAVFTLFLPKFKCILTLTSHLVIRCMFFFCFFCD